MQSTLITRDVINKNIKYSGYDSTDILYDYEYLSREIDKFKNILLKYKAVPGNTVYNFLRGVNSVSLFFACCELGIATAVTDVTYNTMMLYFNGCDYIDAKTKAISPIDFCFVNDYSWNKIRGETLTRERMFHELARVTIKYDETWEDDYTPNDTILATENSPVIKCCSSGTTGTPKAITHNHSYIKLLSERNSKSFYGGVMATRRFHHGSSFATFFLPSLMAENVERIYYIEQKKNRSDNNISFENVDHIQYPYTKDIEYFLQSAESYPNLIVYTLSKIDVRWKKYLGSKIKDVISLFGSSETSGPIFIQRLSDDKFEADRFIDPDGWYNTEVANGRLTLTGDLFKINDDGSYKFLGRDDKVSINGNEISLKEINKEANEIIDGSHLVIDKKYDKVYLCIEKEHDNIDNKILELKIHFKDKFKVSRHAMMKLGAFYCGIKLDNESIRDYFRREDGLV